MLYNFVVFCICSKWTRLAFFPLFSRLFLFSWGFPSWIFCPFLYLIFCLLHWCVEALCISMKLVFHLSQFFSVCCLYFYLICGILPSKISKIYVLSFIYLFGFGSCVIIRKDLFLRRNTFPPTNLKWQFYELLNPHMQLDFWTLYSVLLIYTFFSTTTKLF